MNASAGKLTQAENLIKANYKQDAALVLRQILQNEPENWRAWLALSKVTHGAAKELCLQKADVLQKLAETTPTVHEQELDPTVRYEPATAIQAAQPKQPKPVATSNVELAHPVTSERSNLRHWATVGLVGILLGCLAIFALNAMAPLWNGQSQAIAQDTDGEADLVAAVFETATPTEVVQVAEAMTDEDLITTEELLPTNTPAPSQQQLLAKAIGAEGESREAWTPTPTPTNTPTPTPTIEPTKMFDAYGNSNISVPMPAVAAGERWVDVNLTLQTLTAYEGNSPVFQTIISSGRPPYYTVTGQFRVYYRLESQTMDGRRLGFDYVTPGVPHVQYFYGDFAIHGAFWHNDFGTPVSHGCVNVTPVDAEWLYNWMSYGTLVNVHY